MGATISRRIIPGIGTGSSCSVIDDIIFVDRGGFTMDDLFSYRANEIRRREEPLAARMRPLTIDEIVGQRHIIGRDKLLYRAIKADKLTSVVFYGPPDTGKTTLAKIIANTTKANFRQVNATVAGKRDLVEVVEGAKQSLGQFGRRTILFIDKKIGRAHV